MKPQAIIVDLDGTLCNTDHRQELVAAKKWDEFYKAMVYDTPNQWCLDLIKAMSLLVEIIFVTGRPDSYEKETKYWLNYLDLQCHPLFMRKTDDFRKDALIKTEIYLTHIEPNFRISFCVDDRKQVVDAWRELGLVCLQCAPGEF